MTRFFPAAVLGALLCTVLAPFSRAAPAGGVIRREGWSYDRAEFTNSPDEVAAARKDPNKIPLSGWIEFNVEVPVSGWHELWLGGMPFGWTRDLIVDGQVIYRQGVSGSEDCLEPAPHDGIQFKDTNLYLAAGRHVLRFNRQNFSGSLPAVFELRAVPSDDAAGSVRVNVEGTRILAPDEKITLLVTAGSTRPVSYELALGSQIDGTLIPAASVSFPAVPAGSPPVVKRVEVPFSSTGLYTLMASVNGKPLRPSEFKTGLFLVVQDVARYRSAQKPAAHAEFEFAALFRNGVVLQREKTLPVWGWARPGERVSVTLGNRSAKAVATADGRWQVVFDPLPAGGPLELGAVNASGARLLCKDVLVGEVWLLSGQSNMGGPLLTSLGGRELAEKANQPEVRLAAIYEDGVTPDGTARLQPAFWNSAVSGGNAQVLQKWNAIHFAFGTELHAALNVPVGLLTNNRGGTYISSWTSRAAHGREPTLQPLLEAAEISRREYLPELPMLEKAVRQVSLWNKNGRKGEALAGIAPEPMRNGPALLYESLVAPLAPFAIRGVLWYQGESDSREAEAYRSRFPAFIRDWRATWGDESLPVIFAQIATSNGQPHQGPPVDSPQGELREAQARALALPRTAMIVTMDLPLPGDDVHYHDKLPVGHRFALAALANVYGQKIESSGPMYRAMKIEGSAIRLTFDHAGGLHAKGGNPGGFALAGADRKWVWADAKIDGDTVVVSSPQIAQPVAVRYGWTATPCGANLYNAADLPSPCFRTDDWPLTTAGRIGVTKN